MSLADELLADLEDNEAPEEEIIDTTAAPEEEVFLKPFVPKLKDGKYTPNRNISLKADTFI